MTLDEINVLGNIFNTTFGRSGTENSPTSSTTATLQGDSVIIKYVSSFKMLPGHEGRLLSEDEKEKAIKSIKKFKTDTQEAFRKQCGRKLNMKEVEMNDFIEPVSFTSHNGLYWAFFKATCICELS